MRFLFLGTEMVPDVPGETRPGRERDVGIEGRVRRSEGSKDGVTGTTSGNMYDTRVGGVPETYTSKDVDLTRREDGNRSIEDE